MFQIGAKYGQVLNSGVVPAGIGLLIRHGSPAMLLPFWAKRDHRANPICWFALNTSSILYKSILNWRS